MKTKNWELYITILSEYMEGKGIDFKKHGLNKADIYKMVTFYQMILEPNMLNTITLAILDQLLKIKNNA